MASTIFVEKNITIKLSWISKRVKILHLTQCFKDILITCIIYINILTINKIYL